MAKKSYKKAIELKNTLANSNLAHEYIRIGLYDEAYDILNKAQQEKEIHKNVWSAFTTLEEKEEEEQKQEKEIIHRAIIKQRFIREYASSCFISCVKNNLFHGNWIFEDGVEVIIKQEDCKLEFSWEDVKKESYKVEGSIKNRAVKIKLYKSKYDLYTKQYSFSQESEGYMYLFNNEQNLNMLLLKNNDSEFNIRRLTRIT